MVKLAWIMNKKSRALSLKKRRLGLVKKVRELTILCDVMACVIIFSPNEAEPMVWPSVEAARDLLYDFFALPEITKVKKQMNLESYLKSKLKKVEKRMKKSFKRSIEYKIDQLMVQLQRGRRIVDLTLSEINDLACFTRNRIMSCKKRLGLMQHPPLQDPNNEARTITNDVRMNQSRHYLMDQWFHISLEPPQPKIHRRGSFLPYQGSGSNGNPNMEMVPVYPQVMTFHGLVGPNSKPLQYHNMNNGSINAIATNYGRRQEPPPNGTTVEEGNADAASFHIDQVWPENNNHGF